MLCCASLCCAAVRTLRVGFNNFTGSVPDSMSTMTRLMYVPLSFFYSSHDMPPDAVESPDVTLTYVQGTGAGQLWTDRPGA